MDAQDVIGEEANYIHERACEACGHVMPLTDRHWPRKPGTQYSYQHVCKSCVRAQKTKRKLERAERRATAAFLNSSAVKSGGSNIPHVSELLESVYTLFGGVNGLANQMAMTYHAAPPGGRIRASILESVVRLTTKAAESGATQKPVSLMTDEELEQRLAQKIAVAAEAQRNLSYLRENEVEIPTGLLQMGQGLNEADIAAAMSMRTLVEEPRVEPS